MGVKWRSLGAEGLGSSACGNAGWAPTTATMEAPSNPEIGTKQMTYFTHFGTAGEQRSRGLTRGINIFY